MQIWFLFHIDPYIKLIWVYFPFLKHRIRKREKSKFRKNIVLILIEILALYLITFETFETSWDLTMCSGKLKILYIYDVRNLLHISSLWFYQMKMKMCQTLTPLGTLESLIWKFISLLPSSLRWPCLCCNWAVPHLWSRSLWSAQWQLGLPPMWWLHKSNISWEWKCRIYLDHLDSFMWVFHIFSYISFECASFTK